MGPGLEAMMHGACALGVARQGAQLPFLWVQKEISLVHPFLFLRDKFSERPAGLTSLFPLLCPLTLGR